MVFFGLILGRKGSELLPNFTGVLFVALFVFSFLFSIAVIVPWIHYVVVVFAGAVLGRFFFKSKVNGRFFHLMLSFAFISGYLVGNRAASAFLLLVLFVGAIFVTNKASHLTKSWAA